jgi:dolichol-phosphate mannosyltransferase
MKKPSIFITGAGGFVGANVTRFFLAKGFDVHVAVRGKSNLWRLPPHDSSLHYHRDVLEKDTILSKTMHAIVPNYIIHLASYGAYSTQQDADRMIEGNIATLSRLLTVTNDIPYARLIVAGSSSEYGYKKTSMKETDVCEPNSMYAVTKLAATNLSVLWAKTHHKPITVVRFFSVYGPWEEEGRLVRTVVEHMLRGDDVSLATGKEVRDFIHIDDVADGLFHICLHDKTYGEIFNMGTGRETTILRLSTLVKRLTHSQSRIVLNTYPPRPWDAVHWRADVSKISKMLAWTPKIPLQEGLEKTITWYGQKHG